MDASAVEITRVRTAGDLEVITTLFRAYAASLDVDLAYQDFEGEMTVMPGRYSPPAGELLLARDPDGQPLGCVGLRPIDIPACCEMKRLYVTPASRGRGVGRGLIERLVAVAGRIGYREMRLDTLPSMKGAQALYRALGFEVIEPYYETPAAGTVFMCRRLTHSPAAKG